MNRTDIVRKLEQKNIQTRSLFSGNIIRHPVFNKIRQNQRGHKIIGKLENSDKILNDSFWIGVFSGLTEEKLII